MGQRFLRLTVALAIVVAVASLPAVAGQAPAGRGRPRRRPSARHGAIRICRASGTTPRAHRCSDPATSARTGAQRRGSGRIPGRVGEQPDAIAATEARRSTSTGRTTTTGWTLAG